MLWPGVFYYLANKKIRVVFSVLMFGVSVTSIVNYLFFGTDTGTISTTLIFDNEPNYAPSLIIANLILIGTIITFCFFLHKHKKAITIVYSAAILTVIVISVINTIKINDTYFLAMRNLSVYQEESFPKIRLSSEGKNVVVIMLDRGVSGYIPYIFYEYPEIQEQFDGFVYYPNSMSFGQKTITTSSALFGGYEYTPERIDARADETLAEKHDESLKVMPQLFSEQGYCVTLMDLPFAGWSWNHDYSSFEDIDNCFTYHPKDYFSSGTEANVNIENRRTRNIFMYSVLKCSPLILQNIIYDGGDYLSVVADTINKIDLLENYKVLENLSDMTEISNDYSGCLVLLDNEVTHDVTTMADFDPYNQAEFNGEFYITNGDKDLLVWHSYQAATYECLVVALRALGNYFDYMRMLGVYDNTRIIVVSDHATSVGMFDELISNDINAEWYNCILMVKDFDSTGYTTDYTFMTNADVPSIAMTGIVEAPVNPATGNPINSDLKSSNLYVSYSMDPDETLWNPDLNQGNTFTYDDTYKWFMLTGHDIFNLDNWVQVDNPE